jgi:hypothetical protein
VKIRWIRPSTAVIPRKKIAEKRKEESIKEGCVRNVKLEGHDRRVLSSR